MEYTYEFLRKCHGLRFQATLKGGLQEGIVKVIDRGIMLCFGKKDPGYLVTFGRGDTFTLSKSVFNILPQDFKIIPRNPKTYKDWQVEDRVVIKDSGLEGKIAFRFGDIVVPVYKNTGKAGTVFSCTELFDLGYRLILTDVEQNLIKKRSRSASGFTFREGDPVLVRDRQDAIWKLKVFLKKIDGETEYPYEATDGSDEGTSRYYRYCIPYNKKTKRLFNTNNSY